MSVITSSTKKGRQTLGGDYLEQNRPLNISYETLVRFFEAVEGNYRNALYIRCSTCKHRRENSCGDFLFVPGHDCQPILLPLADANLFMGRTVDSSDCVGILTSHAFLQLYHQWLMLYTDSDETCPFHQMLHKMNANNGSNW